MTLRDELEELRVKVEALGKLSGEERKDLAGSSDVSRKNKLIARSKKYGQLLEDIREVEQDLAEEEGRTAPEDISPTELESRMSQFRTKLANSIKESVSRQKESSAEANLRNIETPSGSLYDVLASYIKEAVPFNSESGRNITMSEMFTRRFSDIGLKNLVTFPDVATQRLLSIADTITGNAGEQIKNFVGNFRLLEDVMEDRREGEQEFDLDGETYNINVGKFFGAINLSDSDSRESVYEYWEKIDGKYEAFENALDAFLESAEKSKNEEFAEKARKFAGKKGILRYVYNIPLVPHKGLGPKKRLIQVIQNLLVSERLASEVEAIAGQSLSEEDRLTDEATLQLGQYAATFSDAMEIDLEEEAIEGGDVLIEETQTDLIGSREDFLEGISTDTDILLAIEMIRSRRLVSATDEMATELRKYLDMAEDMLTEKEFTSVETYFDQFKAEIKNSLILERENYFIPISVFTDPAIKRRVKGLTGEVKLPFASEAEDVIDDIAEFFDDLEVLLKDWENQTMFEVAPKGGQPATSIESREDPSGKISGLMSASNVTIAGKKTKLPKYLEEQKETLKVLVEAIIEYYVNPIYSGRMPVNVPRFASKLGFKDILILAEDLGAETATGKEFMRATSDSVDSIDPDDIRDLRMFFTRVFTKRVKPNRELINSGKRAISSLTELFGSEESNANYISAVLFDVMRSTQDMSMASREINAPSGDKSIMERANLYHEQYASNKSFPIFGLPLYLDMNEGLFYNHPDRRMKSEYDQLVNVLKQTGDDLPVMLKMLLEAHDEIRKSLGKEVQHGFTPLSYDAIFKFLEEEDIDLTTFEVENIVKSYDSHKNIGTEYGIGTEDVYFLKANFR